MDRRTASWPRLLEALVVIPAVVILAVTAKGWTGRSPPPKPSGGGMDGPTTDSHFCGLIG